MKQTIRVSSVQFQHAPGSKSVNLGIIGEYVRKASELGTQCIAFPEMCITGYWHVRNLSRQEVLDLAEPVPSGPSAQTLLALASKYRMTVAAGIIELGEDGKLYNSYIAAMEDGSYACHRKINCFISKYMSSGDNFTVFEDPRGVKIGILTCYDNNIIEHVRITALMGAEVLLAPHQTGGCMSVSPRGMQTIDTRLWENRDADPDALQSEILGLKGRGWLMRWLPARAHDNGLFLVFSNGIGQDDDEVRTGNAMIIDPYGEIITETWKAGNDMVTADLDLSIIASSTGRRWITARRPELYRLIAEPTGKERSIREVRFTPDQ